MSKFIVLIAAVGTVAATSVSVVLVGNEYPARTVTLTQEHVEWNARARHFKVTVKPKEPVRPDYPVVVGNDQIANLLNGWFRDGTAVGLAAVLYDNHDQKHSLIDLRRFPQLVAVRYSDELVDRSLDTGLQCRLMFNRTTIGNSSTAYTKGPAWRSQPRLALADARNIFVLTQHYFGSHLYCYPEHHDYDPGRNGKGGFGDTFLANTPFMVVSQGSSYSDRPFLNALATTLAAFRPDVFQKLHSTGLLCPTVQMIFRHSLKGVEHDADYLTGIAHPPVFDGARLDVSKMLHMAHDMTLDELPPLAILKVVNERIGTPGRDYFEVGPRETLFTTPVAIARMCRSMNRVCEMTVSAAGSRDLNGRELSWHWTILQGDPDLITVEPQNSRATVARLSVRRHLRRPVQPGAELESARVDIGVFVHNGVYYSAPSIISLSWPQDEVRAYDEQDRIQSVQYTDYATGGDYIDPLVISAKNWRDDYSYTAAGQLKGWSRTHPDGTYERFTYDGALVIETDLTGRPRLVQPVRYQGTPRNGRAAILKCVRDGRLVPWQYQSDADEIGHRQQSERSPSSLSE